MTSQSAISVPGTSAESPCDSLPITPPMVTYARNLVARADAVQRFITRREFEIRAAGYVVITGSDPAGPGEWHQDSIWAELPHALEDDVTKPEGYPFALFGHGWDADELCLWLAALSAAIDEVAPCG